LQLTDRDRSRDRARTRDDVILPLQNRTSLAKFKNRTFSKIEKNEVKEADSSTYNKDASLWFEKYNQEFKNSQTAKLLVYGVQTNEVMIRLSNLDDRFDGVNVAKSYKFDINAWAREFYLEANSHLLTKNTTSELLRGIRLYITEMNLAGSIPKSYFNGSFYDNQNWTVQVSDPASSSAQNESANSTSEDSKDAKDANREEPVQKSATADDG